MDDLLREPVLAQQFVHQRYLVLKLVFGFE
jgi:hypothetical protein